jgi:hypothetical protein
MPICIECRYPVPQLYHVLHSSSHKPSYAVPNPKPNTPHQPKTPSTPSVPSSTATTPKRSSAGEAKSVGGGGGDVRLTQCPRCKRFADKYVEHDFVVLFIDLVLVKPQVIPSPLPAPCTSHNANAHIGLQTPSIQPPVHPNRHLLPLHNPSRNPSSPIRCVPNLVVYRIFASTIDLSFPNTWTAYSSAICILSLPLHLHNPSATSHRPLSC